MNILYGQNANVSAVRHQLNFHTLLATSSSSPPPHLTHFLNNIHIALPLLFSAWEPPLTRWAWCNVPSNTVPPSHSHWRETEFRNYLWRRQKRTEGGGRRRGEREREMIKELELMMMRDLGELSWAGQSVMSDSCSDWSGWQCFILIISGDYDDHLLTWDLTPTSPPETQTTCLHNLFLIGEILITGL